MAKSLVLLVVVAGVYSAVDSAEIADVRRTILQVGNKLRVDAMLRLQQEQLYLLATAVGLGQRACIVRQGMPAVAEVNLELARLSTEVKRELMTMPQLEAMSMEDAEAKVKERMEPPIEAILDNRITAMKNCN